MSQILMLLPMIMASVQMQEKTFAIATGVKYLTLENTRLGNPLTAEQLEELVTSFVTLLIAEQGFVVSKITSVKSV